MWMVEEALPGRLTAGKSHQGKESGRLNLKLDGRRVYQLQKYLETQIEKEGQFFEIRELVLLHEDLRKAVAAAQGQDAAERTYDPI
jgi:hypothetical protein